MEYMLTLRRWPAHTSPHGHSHPRTARAGRPMRNHRAALEAAEAQPDTIVMTAVMTFQHPDFMTSR